jgi:hypothetical protein
VGLNIGLVLGFLRVFCVWASLFTLCALFDIYVRSLFFLNFSCKIVFKQLTALVRSGGAGRRCTLGSSEPQWNGASP